MSGLASKKFLIGGVVAAAVLGGGIFLAKKRSHDKQEHAERGPKKGKGKGKEKERKGPRLVSFAGRGFGGTYTVRALPANPEAAKSLPNLVRNTVEKVALTFDPKLPESIIAKVNAAKAKEKVTLSPELLELLAVVEAVRTATNGALDVSQGAYTQAFADGKTVTSGELAKLKGKVGFERLGFDAKERIAKKTVDGLLLDVSALVPAFAADQIAAALDDAKVASYQINVGGVTRVKGEQGPKRPWALTVTKPGEGPRDQVFGRVQAQGSLAMGTFVEPKAGEKDAPKEQKSPLGDNVAAKAMAAAHELRATDVQDSLMDPRTGVDSLAKSLAPRAFGATALETKAIALALRQLDPAAALTVADEKGWAVVLFEKKEDGTFAALESKKFKELTFLAGLPQRFPNGPHGQNGPHGPKGPNAPKPQ